MKPDLYLHIGMEKTGTTSLQTFLEANAVRLEQEGIWYPTDRLASYVEDHAHFPLVAGLVPGEVDFVSPRKLAGRAHCLDELLAEQSRRGNRITLLSAEHFSSRVRDAAALAAFRDRLLEVYGRVHVVAYVRDQPSQLVSAYFTHVLVRRQII